MGNEIYAVDINKKLCLALYGGENEEVEVVNFTEDRIVSKVEDLGESVIFIKILEDGSYIVVTAGGTVAHLAPEKEICIFSVEEDLSAANYNGKLMLGAESGRVYLYDENLDHVNTFGGHNSEIISLDYQEGRILSLSAENLIANDDKGRKLYNIKATKATCFKYITNDVICIGRENKIQVFKETSKLFEMNTEDENETIECLDKTLVIGGNYEHIILLDTTRKYSVFKHITKCRVNKMAKFKENEVIFSTYDGLIGILDIRDSNSLRLYDSGVETIFDFSFTDDIVIIGGENGHNIIYLNMAEPVVLE